jgi:hypothetical protein
MKGTQYPHVNGKYVIRKMRRGKIYYFEYANEMSFCDYDGQT